MNLILLVIIIAARGQSSTLSWLLFVIEHFLGFTTREVLRTRLPIWFQISPDLQMQGFTHGRKILTQNQIWRVNWVYKRSETRTHLIGNWPKNWQKNLLLIVVKLALRNILTQFKVLTQKNNIQMCCDHIKSVRDLIITFCLGVVLGNEEHCGDQMLSTERCKWGKNADMDANQPNTKKTKTWDTIDWIGLCEGNFKNAVKNWPQT